ncbi:MAG: membrane protein insertase YidC [bacterium]
MDKRPLLAMALMLLLLIIFQIFFIPQRQPHEAQPAQPAGEQESREAGAARVVGAAGADAERDSLAGQMPGQMGLAGLELDQEQARRVVVETPLYKAEFSSRGAVLTSFTLKRFLSATGSPVDLVPAGDRLPLGVTLLTATGERVDLGGVGFDVSAESLAVPDGAEASLLFSLTTPAGLTVHKEIVFRGGGYTFGTKVWTGEAGVPAGGLRAIEFGWQSGLATSEANRTDDLRNFAAVTLTDQALVKQDLGKVRKNEQGAVGGSITWSGLRSKYFLVSFVPAAGRAVVAKTFLGTPESIGMVLEADNPGDPLECMVYVGPLDYEGLKTTGYRLERAVDFGWKWLGPLSKLIYKFLVYCYKVVPNYGWVIILLSALIKLLFQPLTAKSMRSMREMQKVQPELQALREKYKKEPQKLNSAMMELYKKRGINPVGGCLPLLLQMPVFFALFNVLSKTIELRQAPFMLWINDLSAPDKIAQLPFSIPFIGSVVSLLPILMGVAMYIQQKMTPTDPKQAMLTYLMPIVFTVMFFKFPSGLVLYWLVNNILTIIHQHWMNRADRLKQEAAPVAAG